MSLDDFIFEAPTVNLNRASRRHIVFEVVAQKMEAASEEAGRPIHKDVDMVYITNPGSRDMHPAKAEVYIKMNPKDEEVRQRYAVWKEAEKKNNKIVGTPLAQLTFLSRSEVADLNALNIYTVEQLVAIPESAHHRIMGVKGLIAKGNAYLKAAEDQSHVTKMAAMLEERDGKIDLLERTIKDLGDRVEAAEKRMRGK